MPPGMMLPGLGMRPNMMPPPGLVPGINPALANHPAFAAAYQQQFMQQQLVMQQQQQLAAMQVRVVLMLC